MMQSGGLLHYSHLARLSDLSRPAVKSHIAALGIAHALFLLPPFHGGGRREIICRPKGYAFDTGFNAFVKGWESIREEDKGRFWEHMVLDELRTVFGDRDLYFWRDNSGREVDFIVKGPRQQADAIECKINPDKFKPDDLVVFRSLYPEGKNLVLSPAIKTPCRRRYGNMMVDFSSTIA